MGSVSEGTGDFSQPERSQFERVVCLRLDRMRGFFHELASLIAKASHLSLFFRIPESVDAGMP